MRIKLNKNFEKLIHLPAKAGSACGSSGETLAGSLPRTLYSSGINYIVGGLKTQKEKKWPIRKLKLSTENGILSIPNQLDRLKNQKLPRKISGTQKIEMWTESLIFMIGLATPTISLGNNLNREAMNKTSSLPILLKLTNLIASFSKIKKYSLKGDWSCLEEKNILSIKRT
jgi:hypothetical protein